jgi:hypothetical protein
MKDTGVGNQYTVPGIPKAFLNFLKGLYSKPELLTRFPLGLP